jgi:hypothetical protein
MSLLIDQSSGGAFPNNDFKRFSKALTLLTGTARAVVLQLGHRLHRHHRISDMRVLMSAATAAQSLTIDRWWVTPWRYVVERRITKVHQRLPAGTKKLGGRLGWGCCLAVRRLQLSDHQFSRLDAPAAALCKSWHDAGNVANLLPHWG